MNGRYISYRLEEMFGTAPKSDWQLIFLYINIKFGKQLVYGFNILVILEFCKIHISYKNDK